MQLYTYELSFFEDETATFTMLDSGLYVMNKYIERYWQEENRHPYILKCDNELAGFVLQRLNENNMNEIAEFFVLNKYRRKGVGTFAANKLFELYTTFRLAGINAVSKYRNSSLYKGWFPSKRLYF